MNLKRLLLLTVALLLTQPLLAWAKPEVTVTIKAEKDIVVVENGVQVTRRVIAEEVTPGEVVFYTIAYSNGGDEAATNVTIVDPIPEGTAYIADSASKVGELTFSIDSGKSFHPPTLLSYEVTMTDGSKERRTASPEDYTQVRWTLPTIKAGGTGQLSFQVRTK